MAKSRKPKAKQIDSKDRITSYRGFLIRTVIDSEGVYDHCTVTWGLTANKWIPKKFRWVGDKEELLFYLDALAECERQKIGFYENRTKFIEDIEPQNDPWVEGPVIRVSARRLLAVLLGLDILEVPANGTLTFVNDEDGVPWVRTVKAELVAQGILPERPAREIVELARARKYDPQKNLNSGINLIDGAEELIGIKDDRPDKPKEMVVSEIEERHYKEQLCMVQNEGKVFYAKRYLTHDGDVIRVETSWRIKGPWETKYENTSKCIALGLGIKQVKI